MSIASLALALAERHAKLFEIDPGFADGIAARYEEEVGSTAAVVAALFKKRAGFATDISGLCDDNRLRDPRLRTTAPGERRLALSKRILGYGDELAELLPRVVELALKRELAQAELIEERSRDRDFADAAEARQELGAYVEAIDTIDRLYNDYKVNRRHHACLGDEQCRDIAAIMLGVLPDTIPVKRRRGRGEKQRG